MQYLYRDGEHYVFMDNVSYDQLQVGGPAWGWLPTTSGGDSLVLALYRDEIVG
jgi:elongation factor P